MTKKGNKNTLKMLFSASSQWSKICFGYQGIIFNGKKGLTFSQIVLVSLTAFSQFFFWPLPLHLSEMIFQSVRYISDTVSCNINCFLFFCSFRLQYCWVGFYQNFQHCFLLHSLNVTCCQHCFLSMLRVTCWAQSSDLQELKKKYFPRWLLCALAAAYCKRADAAWRRIGGI